MAFFKTIFSKLKHGLDRTREAVVSGIRSMLLGKKLDEELISQLERRLLQADVGVKTTRRLVDRIREDFRAGKMERGDQALEYMKSELKRMWPPQDRELHMAPEGSPPPPP